MEETDQNQPPASEVAGSVEISPESALKTSEKLLEYLKHDTERATSDIKLAEERARGNATVAAAAIPLLTFMRSMDPTPTLLQSLLGVLVLVAIAATLLLLTRVMQLHPTERADTTWYAQRQEDAYREQEAAGYDRFLHELQSMWIGYLDDARRLRDFKYRWLGYQNTATLALLLLLVLALLVTAIG